MVNISHKEKVDLKAAMLERLISAGGNFVSGEEISQQLGVSRTSIWKHIQSLRRDGCQIEAMPNKGYRLLAEPDLLLPFAIQTKLKTKIMGQRIYHFALLDSTQAVAHSLAQKGEPEGTVVIAEEQGHGRGRWGRSFFSPRGGLWFSLILRPPLQPQTALVLTLMAGVAVAEAIKGLGGLPLLLKWPNDVLIGEKKVVGILGEMIAEVDVLRFVILGIGVNVNIEREAFPSELQDTATSLRLELGHRVSRSDLLCRILESFEYYYQILLTEGVEPILRAWRSLPSILGSMVSAETPDGLWQGKALDIDQQGALVLEMPGGEIRRVMAGDVRLFRRSL